MDRPRERERILDVLALLELADEVLFTGGCLGNDLEVGTGDRLDDGAISFTGRRWRRVGCVRTWRATEPGAVEVEAVQRDLETRDLRADLSEDEVHRRLCLLRRVELVLVGDVVAFAHHRRGHPDRTVEQRIDRAERLVVLRRERDRDLPRCGLVPVSVSVVIDVGVSVVGERKPPAVRYEEREPITFNSGERRHSARGERRAQVHTTVGRRRDKERPAIRAEDTNMLAVELKSIARVAIAKRRNAIDQRREQRRNRDCDRGRNARCSSNTARARGWRCDHHQLTGSCVVRVEDAVAGVLGLDVGLDLGGVRAEPCTVDEADREVTAGVDGEGLPCLVELGGRAPRRLADHLTRRNVGSELAERDDPVDAVADVDESIRRAHVMNATCLLGPVGEHVRGRIVRYRPPRLGRCDTLCREHRLESARVAIADPCEPRGKLALRERNTRRVRPSREQEGGVGELHMHRTALQC